MFDKEFEFKGKHATCCAFLRNEVGLFKTYREAYCISAIVGFMFNEKKAKENDKDIKPASILPSELAQKKTILTYIYRMIMLVDKADGFTIDDYKNRTFRDDADDEHPERLAANMELFNSYAQGGLELIYDKFKDCSGKKEVINVLNDFLTEFAEDYEQYFN